ncbi:unnamed protein product, partial [Scytosiphon promiscuus]
SCFGPSPYSTPMLCSFLFGVSCRGCRHAFVTLSSPFTTHSPPFTWDGISRNLALFVTHVYHGRLDSSFAYMTQRQVISPSPLLRFHVIAWNAFPSADYRGAVANYRSGREAGAGYDRRDDERGRSDRRR